MYNSKQEKISELLIEFRDVFAKNENWQWCSWRLSRICFTYNSLSEMRKDINNSDRNMAITRGNTIPNLTGQLIMNLIIKALKIFEGTEPSLNQWYTFKKKYHYQNKGRERRKCCWQLVLDLFSLIFSFKIYYFYNSVLSNYFNCYTVIIDIRMELSKLIKYSLSKNMCS